MRQRWNDQGPGDLPLNGRVYVIASEFPAFLQKFLKLPDTARITLVMGMEDMDGPYEIFTSDKYWRTHLDHDSTALSWRFESDYGRTPEQPWIPSLMKASTAGKTVWEMYQMSMETFIRDPRLHHWFLQNNDLTGCSPFGKGLEAEAGSVVYYDSCHTFAADLAVRVPQQHPPVVAAGHAVAAVRVESHGVHRALVRRERRRETKGGRA